MSNTIQFHPFTKTLGDGPYEFVGYFYIDIQAGQQGKPYFDRNKVHPRFVTGAGTCAHCGHAILNIYQIQTGNGEVYGVGSDCILKVGLPVQELTAIQRVERELAKVKRANAKTKRLERQAIQGNTARIELKEIVAKHSDLLYSLPHPSIKNLTLREYADWMLERGGNTGIVTALNKIQGYIKLSQNNG